MAELLAKTTETLQPGGKVTHTILDAYDGESGQALTIEVWIDAQDSRARADRTQDGHRTSEIIVNGRTYDELPSLSSSNTPDVLLSLALPWFIAPQDDLAPSVESSTIQESESEEGRVISIEQVVDLPGGYPYALPCPLRRTLTVDSSSHLPASYDAVFLCRGKGFPADYEYSATYRDTSFLERDSLPESWFSPEAVRAEILDAELQALKASTFDVYWLGMDLPPDLLESPDDGLADARANWPTGDGPAAYFVYNALHSTGYDLRLVEWPVDEESTEPACSSEYPADDKETVMTDFGPALYCGGQTSQLVLRTSGTMVRLLAFREKAEWFVKRADALLPLK